MKFDATLYCHDVLFVVILLSKFSINLPLFYPSCCWLLWPNWILNFSTTYYEATRRHSLDAILLYLVILLNNSNVCANLLETHWSGPERCIHALLGKARFEPVPDLRLQAVYTWDCARGMTSTSGSVRSSFSLHFWLYYLCIYYYMYTYNVSMCFCWWQQPRTSSLASTSLVLLTVDGE